MVQIGMHQATLVDFAIPRRYGLKQTIADTVGVGGIFRGLRTIPFMTALLGEMRELCPDALADNYTNPMSILTWAVYRAFPQQARRAMPQRAIHGAGHRILSRRRPPRLSYDCGGINHMTWFLSWRSTGRTPIPRSAGHGRPGDLR